MFFTGALALVALGLLAKLLSRSVTSPAKACKQAVADDDLAPLLAWVDRHPTGTQTTAFNRAIRQLWDDYEREIATRLIRELASRHAETRIAQYWLDQAQRVEPEIAERALDRDFIRRYYKPEVAAKCGQHG